jgi:AAA domain
MTEPIAELDWLVEPFFAAGDRDLVYAEWSAFKTFLMIHLGLHLALGKDWLGFSVPRSRSVLYLNEDMNAVMAQRRMKQLGTGMNLSAGEAADVPFGCYSRLGVQFTFDGIRQFRRGLQRDRLRLPDVLFVDALRNVLRGSENNPEDMAALWSAVDQLRDDGVTVIMLHHATKPKGKASDLRHRASGTTAIMGGVDGAISLSRPMPDQIVVQHPKARGQNEAAPFAVEIRDIEGKDSPVVFERIGGASPAEQAAPAAPAGGRVKVATKRLAATARLRQLLDENPTMTKTEAVRQVVTVEKLCASSVAWEAIKGVV